MDVQGIERKPKRMSEQSKGTKESRVSREREVVEEEGSF